MNFHHTDSSQSFILNIPTPAFLCRCLSSREHYSTLPVLLWAGLSPAVARDTSRSSGGGAMPMCGSQLTFGGYKGVWWWLHQWWTLGTTSGCTLQLQWPS